MERQPVRSRTRYALVFEIGSGQAGASRRPTDDDRAEMETFLARQGFGRRRGSLYFGDETVDVVRCIVAMQDMAEAFEGFAASVSDPRVLRIEAEDDLMPAIERVRLGKPDERRRTVRLDA